MLRHARKLRHVSCLREMRVYKESESDQRGYYRRVECSAGNIDLIFYMVSVFSSLRYNIGN